MADRPRECFNREMTAAAFLSDFRSVAPRHLSPQEQTLSWLAAAHAQAEAGAPSGSPRRGEGFETLVRRYACRPEQVASRGHELADFLGTDWDAHRIYRLHESPGGAGLADRTEVFAEAALRLMAEALPDGRPAPEHLIHVTCTGYTAPSAAQLLVARRAWPTTVTHAYHMGCAAAFPAVRMAAAFAAPRGAGRERPTRVEVVHTELCSLHLDPSDHSPEQLVAQGLFADGCIAYSTSARKPEGPSLELLALRETLVPGTEDAMSWRPGARAMRMTLSKEMPALVRRHLRPFVEGLLEECGAGPDALARCVFAVHPGGPRIIDAAREILGLSEAQVAWSRAVLRERGNMSSATIPHVWKAVLEDPAVPAGALVPSVAFGPGLTVGGAVFRKSA